MPKIESLPEVADEAESWDECEVLEPPRSTPLAFANEITGLMNPLKTKVQNITDNPIILVKAFFPKNRSLEDGAQFFTDTPLCFRMGDDEK